MWTEIGVFLIETIAENSILSLVEKSKKDKEKRELKSLLSRLCFQIIKKYDDTTLDCGEFFKYIKSIKFNDFLYRLFNTPYDGESSDHLIEWFVGDASQASPKCQKHELRSFIKDIDALYKDCLHTILKDDVTLYAFWDLLTITNRKFYQRIFESEENIIAYLKTCFSPNHIIESDDLTAYHEHCIKEFSKINFSGIVGAEIRASKSIDELYVENKFVVLADFLSEKVRRYALQKKAKKQLYEKSNINAIIDNVGGLLKLSNRIVLVGGAGYGKTTTVNYLFCKYKDLMGADILRIKLNLKDYANELENNKDIFECLLLEVSKRTKRSKQKNLESALTQYIESGNALIIFDALDEIPSETLREKARSEISSFVELYHLNKYIITSREVGYLRNKFDESFLHVRICSFDDTQIEKYSENWYNQRTIEDENENAIFDEFYQRFSDEVAKSKCIELIRNPIVLVLALIIFDASNTLPHKRVEFYKKCIDTFLTTREEGKGAFVFSNQAKNILGNSATIPTVAYYRYQEMSRNTEYRFTREELNKFILRSLEVREEAGWIDAAQNYTKYLVERTELIRETDENIFDFSHKTFGEYFLACYFANNTEISELLDLLKQWIGDPNKDELASLVVEVIIQQNQKQQHEAVINMLFDITLEMHNTLESAKTRDSYEKIFIRISDYTSLLFNIVRNGMLIPKFVEKLYSLLIECPDLMQNDQRIEHKEMSSPTLCPIDAKEYIRKSALKERDSNDVAAVIERYCYLCNTIVADNKFLIDIKDLFIKEHSTISETSYFLDYLYNLFCNSSVLRTFSTERKFAIPELDNILAIVNNNEGLFESSLVFLMIVHLLCIDKGNRDGLAAEWISKFNFTKNNYFPMLINPSALHILLNNALRDDIWFLISIIAFVKCTDSSAFFYLDWLRKNPDSISIIPNKQQDDQYNSDLRLSLANASIIKGLFATKSICEFVNYVKSEGHYNSTFDEIYNSLFPICKEYYDNIRTEEKIKKVDR